MANIGSLPALPGPRLALDKDGSKLLIREASSASWTDHTADLPKLAGIDTSVYISFTGKANGETEASILFPDPLNLLGVFFMSLWSIIGYSYSTDTTDGIDGTWSAYAAAGVQTQSGYNAGMFRTNITNVNVAGVKGLRVKMAENSQGTSEFICLHVYGTYGPGNRLEFWNPGNGLTLDPNALNFGDMPHGITSPVRSFAIKNLSTTGTATNVQVARTGMPGADFANGSGTGVQLSLDQVNWFGSVGLGNLGPGVVSQTVYMKVVADAGLPAGLPRASELTATCDGIA